MAAQEPSAPQVFEPLVKEGEVELQRGPKDLALSGFIAGLDIGFGPLAMAVVAGRLHAAFHLTMAQALFLGSFLYPLGFVVVVMGQSELFTEHTLTPVAGLLAGEGSVGKLAKRWGSSWPAIRWVPSSSASSPHTPRSSLLPTGRSTVPWACRW